MFKNEISNGFLKTFLYVSALLLAAFLLFEIKVLLGYILIAAIISLIGQPIVNFLITKLKFKTSTASVFKL